jgi:hypothetical protein
MTGREREFAEAARVVDESLVMQAIARITHVFVERPFQGRGLLAAGRLTAALKGPLYVLGLGIACLTHAVLLQWMPDRIAPVKPLAYGMVVAFAAFATLAGFIATRSSATATADSSAGTANTRKS